MELLPFYIFISAILHITEEYYFPGGFMIWTKKKLPFFKKRLTVKAVVIINGLFLLLCITGIISGGSNPGFILSISGLILFNAALHIFSSIFTLSCSPGLITSLIFYLPVSIYSFIYYEISSAEILMFILFGFLYHLIVPLVLFAPFNKPVQTEI